MLRAMSDQAGVKVMTGLKCSEITQNSVIAVDADGKTVTFDCDSVVLSMGVRPRKAVAAEFDGTAYDVFYIGDCAAKAGNITSAVRDGFYAAMNI
jgi:thioredoxin reductase